MMLRLTKTDVVMTGISALIEAVTLFVLVRRWFNS